MSVTAAFPARHARLNCCANSSGLPRCADGPGPRCRQPGASGSAWRFAWAEKHSWSRARRRAKCWRSRGASRACPGAKPGSVASRTCAASCCRSSTCARSSGGGVDEHRPQHARAGRASPRNAGRARRRRGLGFRRFYESEFSSDLPPTIAALRALPRRRVQARRGESGRCSACARCSKASNSCRPPRPERERRTMTRTGDDMIEQIRRRPTAARAARRGVRRRRAGSPWRSLLSGRGDAAAMTQLREHVARRCTSLAQNIPLQAGAAVRGSAPAFEALDRSRQRLERVLTEIDAGKSTLGLFATPSARVLGVESDWPALLEQSQAVLDGRRGRAQGAAGGRRRARFHATHAVSASANVLKALGPSRPDWLNRSFERFELRAQAVRAGPVGTCGRHRAGRRRSRVV